MRPLSAEEEAIYERARKAWREYERRKYGRFAHKFTFKQVVEAHDELKYSFRAAMMVRGSRQRERYEELRKKGRLIRARSGG
jgi:hypothetical protein